MWSWQLKKLNQEERIKLLSAAISAIAHVLILVMLSRAGKYALLAEAISLTPHRAFGVPVRFGITKTAYTATNQTIGKKNEAQQITRRITAQQPLQKAPAKGVSKSGDSNKAQAKQSRKQLQKKRQESLLPVKQAQKPLFSEFKREFSLVKAASKSSQSIEKIKAVVLPKAVKQNTKNDIAQTHETKDIPVFSEFKRVEKAEMQSEVPVEKTEVQAEKPISNLDLLGKEQEIQHQTQPINTDEYALAIETIGPEEIGQYTRWQQDIVHQIHLYLRVPPGFEDYTGACIAVEIGHTDGKAKTIEESKGMQRALYQAYKSCILKINFPKETYGKRIILTIN